MLSSRGSALLELLISTAIVAVITLALMRTMPLPALKSLRGATTEAIAKRTIEVELHLAARSNRNGIASPIIVDPKRILSIGAESIATPLPNSSGLLYLDNAGFTFEAVRIRPGPHIDATLSVPNIGIARAETGVGCAANRCVELTCRLEVCRLTPTSALLPLSIGVNPVPHIAVVYRASSVTMLYVSARKTLRKVALVGGKPIENQPILDGIHSFLPRVERPAQLRGAALISAQLTLSARAQPIEITALDPFAPPRIPIPLTRLASL